MFKLFIPVLLLLVASTGICDESIKTLDSGTLKTYTEDVVVALDSDSTPLVEKAETEKKNIMVIKPLGEIGDDDQQQHEQVSILHNTQCNSDEDCIDPNSICDYSSSRPFPRCTCNEFHEETFPLQGESNLFIVCKRRSCTSSKDCSLGAYCKRNVCWPRCSDDAECLEETNQTCDMTSGICSQKCSVDSDCKDLRESYCDTLNGMCRVKCDPDNEEGCQTIPVLCDSSYGACHSRCFEESECKANEYCDSQTNFCFKMKCTEDVECAVDQYCSKNNSASTPLSSGTCEMSRGVSAD